MRNYILNLAMIATRQGYKIGFRSHSIRDFTKKNRVDHQNFTMFLQPPY